MRMSTIMEPDESMGEDARSITYFDMYVSQQRCFLPPFLGFRSSALKKKSPERGTDGLCCRILQREGERDLFALRQPAMASDDDTEDGYDIEIDDPSDDETQGAAAAAGRGREGATSELQRKTFSSTYFHISSRSRRRRSGFLGSIEPP
jgi:hypothetical protein